MRNIWLIVSLAATVACLPESTVVGVKGCTGCSLDGGRPDAGKPDGGPRDAGTSDAGIDGGPPDGGPPDAGGPEDGGSSDSGIDAGLDSGLPLTGNVCPPGSLNFEGFVTDLCADETLGTNVPLPGVQVATLQPYSATLTDSSGDYTICMPPNVPETLVYSMPNYVTTYFPELALSPIIPPARVVGEMQLACTTAVQNYAAQQPNYDTSAATVYGLVLSVSETMGSSPCYLADGGYSGWTFQATLPDGGIGPGGPWPTDYFDRANNLQGVSSTFAVGRALMYNIDPSVGFVAVTATNPPLESSCELLDATIGFTDRVFVSTGTFSVYPWIVP